MMLMHPMLERKSVPADGCIKSGQELSAPKEGPVDDMVAVSTHERPPLHCSNDEMSPDGHERLFFGLQTLSNVTDIRACTTEQGFISRRHLPVVAFPGWWT